MLNWNGLSVLVSALRSQSSFQISQTTKFASQWWVFVLVVLLFGALSGCSDEETEGFASEEPESSWAGSGINGEGDNFLFPALDNPPENGESSEGGDGPVDNNPEVCQLDCSGVECGDDGCGGLCGVCPLGTSCSAEGQCIESCNINCVNKECGEDGCGGLCGSCGIGTSCNEHFECVEPPVICTPSCDEKECGDNGCGGLCGECAGCNGPDATLCNDGQCAIPCCPDCEGKLCGDDGCAGLCGICEAGTQCEAGSCICEPNCQDAVCGDNGCGGSCGTCAADETCIANQCEWFGSESIAYRFLNPSSNDHMFVMSANGPPATPEGYIAEGPWFFLNDTPAATITLHQWETFSGGNAMGVNLSGPEGWPNVQNPTYLGDCSPVQLVGMVPLVGLYNMAIPDTLATFGDEVVLAQVNSDYAIIQTWCYVTPVVQ